MVATDSTTEVKQKLHKQKNIVQITYTTTTEWLNDWLNTQLQQNERGWNISMHDAIAFTIFIRWHFDTWVKLQQNLQLSCQAVSPMAWE